MSTSSRITRNLRRGATYGSALVGQTATFTGDGASDTLTFAESGGLLNHNQTGGGFNSIFDFATAVAGDQTLSSMNLATVLVVNAGGGADTVRSSPRDRAP